MLPSAPPRFQKSGVPVGKVGLTPDSKVGLGQKLPAWTSARNEAGTEKRARAMRNSLVFIGAGVVWLLHTEPTTYTVSEFAPVGNSADRPERAGAEVRRASTIQR